MIISMKKKRSHEKEGGRRRGRFSIGRDVPSCVFFL
jgi:hypothetical protein